ncbi:hypothetical protein (nucleomorph) [Guillardia theta]|uniref:Uncharacterized protein n=1 Tax=Guillardia theta TaxID=55529 RepID=Q9AQX7_GUITH|nr:hypothetical protein GTHECHR2129 [Guillardia theta]XP_001713331.1 hypothetical protein GTHECHR2189 [Guillardia theta]XP_001713489.1 hypothetical protein GTHECHR3155 [Guillardia theta]XP_001713491.1 hypothetical protein GTHECHR3157 [Guillardia theta]XP_001713647.1 hypothetical protein GTHECHR1149 [Guillardia theta]XP_001713649.1 hypothetical protein GTHECHR1151 [Guillardia theta]AAK39791.1 hypothetical protein [Guillardia theta]AAK39793.1 hypothetical protein [Guillardia theta]AAK39942.1 
MTDRHPSCHPYSPVFNFYQEKKEMFTHSSAKQVTRMPDSKERSKTHLSQHPEESLDQFTITKGQN